MNREVGIIYRFAHFLLLHLLIYCSYHSGFRLTMFSPYGSNSSINATSEFWRPNPSTRGTYDILSTCVITMSLCVWSALHLNIPEYGSSSHGLPSKIRWVLIGLLVPEVVAWAAFQQRREASRLHHVMRSALGQEPPQSSFKKFFKRMW